jgi:hypothetical protein
MNRERWKNVERKVALLLGGKRIPLLGREGADLDTPYIYPEVKSRKDIGKYLWDNFFNQILFAFRQYSIQNKVPAIVIHRPGMEYGDALVCVRARDWQTLIDLIHQEMTNDSSHTNTT